MPRCRTVATRATYGPPEHPVTRRGHRKIGARIDGACDRIGLQPSGIDGIPVDRNEHGVFFVSPDTPHATTTVQLTDDERRVLRSQLITRGRLLKDIALMPLALFGFTLLATLPVGLLVLLIAGVDTLFGLTLLKDAGLFVPVVWAISVIVVNGFAFRGTVAEYRARFATNAPLEADLAAGIKQCETLRIDEALCVQENEHGGLGYFCRVADGRVIFVLDYASASWEDEDLAAGYRRGVDPRQERFVPTDTLRVCRGPARGHVFDEDFSGSPVPRVEGIYQADVAGLPESGTFVEAGWQAVCRQYLQDANRVNWAEVTARDDKARADA
jgi:hypothetical protein